MRDFLTILKDLKMRLIRYGKYPEYPETLTVDCDDLAAIGSSILQIVFSKCDPGLIAPGSEEIFSHKDKVNFAKSCLQTLFDNRTAIIAGYNQNKRGLASATYEDRSETEIKI